MCLVVYHAALSCRCTCLRTRVNTFLLYTGKFPVAVSVKYTLWATPQLGIAKVTCNTSTLVLVPFLVAEGISTTRVWNTRVMRWGLGPRKHHLWSWCNERPFSLWNGIFKRNFCCISNGWKRCCGRLCFLSHRWWQSGRLGSERDGSKCAAYERVPSKSWQTAADGIVIDDATLGLNPTCTTAWINTAILETSQERRTLTGHYTLGATCWGVANEASLTQTPTFTAHLLADGIGTTWVTLTWTPWRFYGSLCCGKAMQSC